MSDLVERLESYIAHRCAFENVSLHQEAMEEIQRLQAELSDTQQFLKAAELSIENRDATIASLQAELAEAREDSKRLDWLDTTNTKFKIGWKCNVAPAGNVGIGGVIQPSGALTTIRQAIDTAMREGE